MRGWPRWGTGLALAAALFFSGCLGGEPASEESRGAPATLSIGSTEAGIGEPLLVEGGDLFADCAKANDCPDHAAPFWPGKAHAPCDGANCERTLFKISTPSGTATADLQIVATWTIHDDDYSDVPEYIGAEKFHVDVGIGAPGAPQEGIDLAPSGKYGAVGRFDGLASGEYELVAVAQWGEGSYEVTMTVLPSETPSEESGELLPDLVVGPPRQLRIETPLGREAEPLLLTSDPTGCGTDEAVDEGAQRCLRFASDVGNVGAGFLDLWLPRNEALAARVTGGAEWVQHVHSTDGSVREKAVADAEYHPTHGHYHIEAFARTAVHSYDEATSTRGEVLAEGGKTGFCVLDGGPLLTTTTGMAPPLFDGTGCCYYVAFCELDAVFNEDFRMGISAGWFDIYPWWRSGQYVDIGGLGDGTYEMVTVLNPDGLIIETDENNNSGGVVFRLAGDDIEIVSTWTHAPEGAYDRST